MPPHFVHSREVAAARDDGRPIVALETSIVAQGFPRPDNLALARDLAAAVRDAGAVPAFLAVLDGRVHVGLEDDEVVRVASSDDIAKASSRDLGVLIAQGRSGATTVAACVSIAHSAGIEVFATGGIGGVHPMHGGPADISADLFAMARAPVLVVSAGAKSILDLPATLEALDSLGVPVVGYGTDMFPAFFCLSSGLPVPQRLDDVKLVAAAWRAHRDLGLGAGMLLANPPPAAYALPPGDVAAFVATGEAEARAQGISGPRLTPFLLGALNRLSDGRTRTVNRALAIANATLAAGIARALG